MIERVHIVDEFQTFGHRVIILGRAYPGAPRSWLNAEGQWQDLEEGATPNESIGFRFPEGALDALVSAYQGVAAPQPATERHLTDAITVRDRLLAVVERKYDAP